MTTIAPDSNLTCVAIQYNIAYISPIFLDNGIFHGIDSFGHRKNRANTRFSRLLDNRVGVDPTDSQWMEHALSLAGRAAAEGEVPVGAVVVMDGEVIGEGWNRPISSTDPTAHAEIVAMREAAQRIDNYRLSGATLYVTLEPCLMCSGAMVHARIARLVFGASDPKRGAVNSTAHAFDTQGLNHRVQAEGGVLAEQCSNRLQDFFRERR